ncbi:GFA family protein [Candidatus Nitrotoga sp. HW29]|uniref:GFA family protein n=1 Tax=Candidatus Nitrotoga sp. HW29 TaxID=2886963 RepID=UPI001EF2DAD3|nr:GFA family protein [Candidatus Nitrotoga sp. HW29]CAH1904264.1 GFA family protein [Candidatus Nitrotoga sp. HW29]
MKGKCLCGSIEVVADDHGEINLCHCTMCRRWTSGPMFAVHCGSNVSFNGLEPTSYQSSDWAVRGFCGKCGTHLFYHLLPSDEYILSAGLFQDHDFELLTELFIDEKPDFYALANETQKITGQEVFDRFSSDS